MRNMSTLKKTLAVTAVATALVPTAAMVADASQETVQTVSYSTMQALLQGNGLGYGLPTDGTYITALFGDASADSESDYSYVDVASDSSFQIEPNRLYKINVIVGEDDGSQVEEERYFTFEMSDNTLVPKEVNKAPNAENGYTLASDVLSSETSYVSMADLGFTATNVSKVAVPAGAEVEVAYSKAPTKTVTTDVQKAYYFGDTEKENLENNRLSETFVEIEAPTKGEFVVITINGVSKVISNDSWLVDTANPSGSELLTQLVIEEVEGANYQVSADLAKNVAVLAKETVAELVDTVVDEQLESADFSYTAEAKDKVAKLLADYNFVTDKLKAKQSDSLTDADKTFFADVEKAFTTVVTAYETYATKLQPVTTEAGATTFTTAGELLQAKTDFEKSVADYNALVDTDKYTDFFSTTFSETSYEALTDKFAISNPVLTYLETATKANATPAEKNGALASITAWKANNVAQEENKEYIASVNKYVDSVLTANKLDLNAIHHKIAGTPSYTVVDAVEGNAINLFLDNPTIDLTSITFNGEKVLATKKLTQDEAGVVLQNVNFGAKKDGVLSFKYMDADGVVITKNILVHYGKTAVEKNQLKAIYTALASKEPNQAMFDRVVKTMDLYKQGYNAKVDDVAKYYVELGAEGTFKELQVLMQNFEDALKLYNSITADGVDEAAVTALVGANAVFEHDLEKTVVNELYKSVVDFTASVETNKTRVKTLLPLLSDLDKFIDTMDTTTYRKLSETKTTLVDFLDKDSVGGKFLTSLDNYYKSVALTTDALGASVVPTKEVMESALRDISTFSGSLSATFVRDLTNTLSYTIAVNDFTKVASKEATDVKALADNVNKYLVGTTYNLPSGLKSAYLKVYNDHKAKIGYTDGVVINPEDGTATKPDTGDSSNNLKESATNAISLDKLVKGQVLFVENGSDEVVLEISGFSTAYKDNQTLTVTVGDDEEVTATYDKATQKWVVKLENMENGKQEIKVLLKQGKLTVERQTLEAFFTSSDALVEITDLTSKLQSAKGAKKPLDAKDYEALENYYVAMILGEYPEEDGKDEKVFGLEAFENAVNSIKALGYSKAHTAPLLEALANEAVNFLNTVEYDYHNEDIEDLPNVSIESLSAILGVSATKYTNIEVRDLLVGLEMYLESSSYSSYAESAEELLGYLSTASNLISNPTDAGIKAAKKTITDKLSNSNTLRIYLEQLLDTATLLTAKELNTEDLEDALDALNDLESTDMVDALINAIKGVNHLNAFKEGKMTYDTTEYDDEIEELNAMLADKTLSESNTLYKSLKDQYREILKQAGVDPETIEGTPTEGENGETPVDGEKPSEGSTNTTITLDKTLTDAVVAGTSNSLNVTVAEGLAAEIALGTNALAKAKETLGNDFSLEVDVTEDKANGKVNFVLKASNDKGSVLITDLGKMSKIVISNDKLDMSNGKRLFRVVNGEYIPVLGKAEPDGSFTIHTQYLGEFVVMEKNTVITDIGNAFNPQDVQEFVDRGILKVDGDKFNPKGGITIKEMTESINRAFGAGATDNDKIKEVLGSSIDEYITSNMKQTADGSFEITREQTAVVITGLLEKYEGKPLEETIPTYKDITNVDAETKTAIGKMYAADIMIGYKKGETFGAKDKLTKSQFTKVLRKALVRIGLIDSI